jgi:alpha-2-macroglobulin
MIMAEANRSQLVRFVTGKGRAGMVAMATVGVALVLLVSNITSLPDNEIRVVSFEPTGWVDLKTNFTIKFTKAMVSKDSLDLPLTDPPVLFSPPIPGLGRWIDTDVLRFFPDGELKPATQYTARVESNKTWACGFKIVDKTEYSFRTPNLKVDLRGSSTNRDESTLSMVRLMFELSFNYPIGADELRRQMKIKGDAGAVTSNLQFTLRTSDQEMGTPSDQSGLAPRPNEVYARRFYVTSEPFAQTSARQKYVVSISEDLMCRDCGSAMNTGFSQTITVEPRRPLEINNVQPSTEATGSAIHIYFSESMEADQAKPYISIEPAVPFNLEEEWGSIILRGTFSPGMAVTVNIGHGLRTISGTALEEDFSTRVVFPDIPPTITFTSRAVFMPRLGNGLLEFKTINVKQLAVEVEQIFPNNLVYFLTSGYGDYHEYYRSSSVTLGRTFFVKDLDIESPTNETVLTTVDLKSIIGDSAQGIFKIAVRNREQRWISDGRYAMLTDIGISARLADDYLMVWANSLATSEPISGASVALISRNNQTLVEGKTDSRGIATFENIKDKLSGFEPFVVRVSRTNEMAFIRLDESLLPLSDFDVAGRPYLATGYEAFVYADRGVYRPGDTAHLVSLVRGVNATLPPAFPYSLTIYDSRGRKFTSFRLSSGGSSMTTVDLPVPDFAGTGKYTAVAEIGEELQIGRTEFQIEEFMPDRIKVTLNTPTNSYKSGDTIQAEVGAKYLFGPPAANHKVAGHLTIEPQNFAPKGWSQYCFGDNNRTFTRMEVDLRDTILNDTGGHVHTYVVPDKLAAPSALKGLLSATVSEEGGRGISAYAEVMIHPYARYVGLRLGIDGYAKIGEPVTAQIVSIDHDGKAVAADSISVKFYRIVYNTLYKRDKTGVGRYVSEKRRQVRDSSAIAVSTDGATVSFTPDDYGEYEIVAADPVTGHSAAVEFYASGWGFAPWAMTNPDKIELQLDKTTYATGSKALLQVRAPFGGRLLLTIEKDKVLETITRDMPENTAEIELPVKADYFPNVYITAAVIRGANNLEPNMPARAFGVVPLRVQTDSKRLNITMTAPGVVKPKSAVTVNVQIDRPKVTQLTLAAVDAGILQLTDFVTPDPLEFFYGKKQPHLNPYDMYALIYPHVDQAQNQIRPGGDKMFAAGRKRHLNPITARRVKSVALWSGLVQTDALGKAAVSFTLPEFNGKLVLMAVAAQDDLFGSATGEIMVRDKIVVQESFPRFVSPNDIFVGLVTLFNNTGQKADITVTARPSGRVELISPPTTTITLENNREGNVEFRCQAGLVPGKIQFAIDAEATGEKASLSIELPNRPAQPLTLAFGSGVANRTSSAEFTFPDDWLKGTDQYVLKTSSLPAVSFARNVQYLLSYPYGCVEQTTSRLFPLLYFNDLVKVVEPGLFGGRGPQYFIQEGIQRLHSMFLPNKSFSFWPGGSFSNNWSTVYASHCISEASRAGYQVDKKFLSEIYDHLEDMAQGKNAENLSDAHRIYAAYVLAQANRLPQKVVSYLKNLDPSTLQPYSRYQLAGALALSGNMSEAMKLIPASIQPNLFEPETGGDFNSGTRTDAILLETLLAISPGDPSIEVLAGSLMQRASVNQWYTTQDNAFALMALGKYFRQKTSFAFKGQIIIEGDKSYRIDSSGFSLTRDNLGGRKVSLSVNEGEGTCFYYWQASGIPLSPAAEEFDRGMIVRRQYLDENGQPISLDSLPLGSQVVAVISARAVDKNLEYVVINDLLPAGFEVENPRLKTTPRLGWVPTQAQAPEYMDIRDDRLLIFTSLNPGNEVKFYYSLRATCAGEFKVPPVAAECMYNPLVASSSSSGAVTIVR